MAYVHIFEKISDASMVSNLGGQQEADDPDFLGVTKRREVTG